MTIADDQNSKGERALGQREARLLEKAVDQIRRDGEIITFQRRLTEGVSIFERSALFRAETPSAGALVA
jgi:hypothetical protein